MNIYPKGRTEQCISYVGIFMDCVKLYGGVIIVRKYEGARYSDVNEVMHRGRWRVYILAAWSVGCCFTRCIVSLTEPGCQSWFGFLFRQQWSRGWPPHMSWHPRNRQIWLAARLSVMHCMKGFWLPVPGGFLVSVLSAKCPLSSMCPISVIMSWTLTSPHNL